MTAHVKCFNPKTHLDLPRVAPGTEVEREDGKIYTVAKDGGILIDSEGFYVGPFTLKRFPNQEFAARIASIGLNTTVLEEELRASGQITV